MTAVPEADGLRRSESDPAMYVTPPSSPASTARDYRSTAWSISEEGSSEAASPPSTPGHPGRSPSLEGDSRGRGIQQSIQSHLANPAVGLGRMTRSVSSSLLTAGTGLVVSASQAAMKQASPPPFSLYSMFQVQLQPSV